MSHENLSLESLRSFIHDQEKILQNDKARLLKNEGLKLRHSTGSCEAESQSYKSDKHEANQEESRGSKNKVKLRSMVKDRPQVNGYIDKREKEKDKLINVLSVPKSRHSCSSIEQLRKRNPPSSHIIVNFTTDPREREKDRLAEIFASSGNKFLKSSYPTCKNVNDKLLLEECQKLDLNKTKTEYFDGKDNQNCVYGQKSNLSKEPPFSLPEDKSLIRNQKYNIPKVLVTEYQDDFGQIKIKTNTESNADTMVRIGEFSPLNPNHPAGRPTLGIGENDERRRILQDQQKKEYNEYLQQTYQASRSQTPSRDISDHNNHQLKNAATQTEWGGEDNDRSPARLSSRHCVNQAFGEKEPRCTSPPTRLSPLPQYLEGLSEREIKEHLYRDELRRQIEEKNRRKEMLKRKEAEEEARMEAKFHRDQEEMRRQFEAERFHRLELAIRKKEQEDLLRERLAAEQQRALQECKAKKKQLLKNKSLSPTDTSKKPVKKIQSDTNVMPLTTSMPEMCASKVFSDVHEVLRKPLLEPTSDDPATEAIQETPSNTSVPSRVTSASGQPSDVNTSSLRVPSPPIHRVKEVDVLVQQGLFDPKVQRNVPHQVHSALHRPPSPSMSEKMKEVESLLKQPLLTDRSFQVLPPMSPPLLHASIPPIAPSYPTFNPPRSPPVPGSRRVQRTNSQVLNDKWKVPYVERSNDASPDVFTKHNRSVLTQLGAFRRHLQQERVRMQQRLRDESP